MSSIVVEKFIRKGRWYVRVNPPINDKSTMLNAVYVWLKGNPAFISIPKGYVIHHLDHDEQNDDISNLVIMQKHHHAAHHWKQKTIKPTVNIHNDYIGVQRTVYSPVTEPSVIYRKDNKTFFIYFREIINGEKVRTRITRNKGKTIKTLEEALEVKKAIWPGNQLVTTQHTNITDVANIGSSALVR
jgi:hypothetical protein